MKTMAKLVELFNKKSVKKLELLDFGITNPGHYALAVEGGHTYFFFKSCNDFREFSRIYLEMGWRKQK